MKFIPAGELLGNEHQVRNFVLKGAPGLPDGKYSLVDCHCTDSECDCRKTMIQLLHNDTVSSVINFGWESEKYYKDWYSKGSKDLQIVEQMKGPSIDINSPDLINREAVLGLFKYLLNEQYIDVLKSNYKKFKAALNG